MQDKNDEKVIEIYSKNHFRYDKDNSINFLWGEATKIFFDTMTFPKGTRTIADIGSGTGIYLQKWLKRIEGSVSVIAIEPAKGMRKVMEKRFKDSNNILIKEGRFENLPIEDGSVDFIISSFAFHYVKDFDKAISEIKRISSNKAQFCLIFISDNDGAEFWKIIKKINIKNLTFRQRINLITQVKRFKYVEVYSMFNKLKDLFDIEISTFKKTIYGELEQFMEIMQARSGYLFNQINGEMLENHLKEIKTVLNKIKNENGIQYKLDCFIVRGKSK